MFKSLFSVAAAAVKIQTNVQKAFNQSMLDATPAFIGVINSATEVVNSAKQGFIESGFAQSITDLEQAVGEVPTKPEYEVAGMAAVSSFKDALKDLKKSAKAEFKQAEADPEAAQA